MTGKHEIKLGETFGEGRRCFNGPDCVVDGPTVLSRFNPGPECYCCQRRAKQGGCAEREPSTAEVMEERVAVAA